MSVIWSGVTEEGAVVPVQVTNEGKVVAVGDGPQGEYLPLTGGTLTGDLKIGDINLKTDGSASFASSYVNINSAGTIIAGRAGNAAVFIGKTGNAFSGTTTSTIYATGAANFTGEVKIGGIFPDAPNITLNATDGSAQFQGALSSPNYLTTNASIHLDGSDGSAEFNGKVGINRTPSNVSWLGVDLPDLADNYGIYVRSKVKTLNNLFAYATGNQGNTGATGLWYTQGDLEIGTNLGSNSSNVKIALNANGSAEFAGDVVIGSRGEKWLIRESNGVAMLVQQSRDVAPMIPEKVRDIPAELDLIEMALNEVMEKLRMTPPAGWPVWDGSDNP